MMFTCIPCSGPEAERIGLANLSVPDEEFDVTVDTFVRSILENSWFSHSANKRLVKAADHVPLWAGLAHEAYHTEGVGPDFASRMAGWKK
jgi:enoyl-CoA hydratase